MPSGVGVGANGFLHFQRVVPLKYEPELRVFHIEQLILVHNIHLLGGIQKINSQAVYSLQKV
jgi:hypothetical protein